MAAPGSFDAWGTVTAEKSIIKDIAKDETFADIYTFSLADTGSTVAGSWEFANILSIKDYTFTLLQNTGAGLVEISSANYGSLTSGTYSAQFTGTGDGDLGGKYAFSVSPVPEASTLVMMLSGFGLIGLMSYRRRSAV